MNLKGEHIILTHSKSPGMRNVCEGYYFQSKFVFYKARFSTCRCDASFVIWYFLQRCLSLFIVVYCIELITDSWLFEIVFGLSVLKNFMKMWKGNFYR